MEPLVSVIVVTYNSAEFVLQTLESVKEQTYRNIELIVTDDCSKDNSVEICEKWCRENQSRFKRAMVITTPFNTGIPANLNRAVKAAQGEWIKGIAGDDLFFPDAIEIFMDAFNADTRSEKSVFHARIAPFNDNLAEEPVFSDAEKIKSERFNQPGTSASEQFTILLRFCPVSAPAVFIKKTVLEELGYYNEKYKFWEDRPMWLKMTSNGIKLHYVDAPVVKYRLHTGSVQNNAGNTLFSRTLLSMMEAYREIIIPYLTRQERFLYNYLFGVRKLFFILFRNKKNFLTAASYKLLSMCAENRLNKIKSRYSP
ncbi:MAG: glycosyltransferase [Bacteroidales bacterium]|nr:glycosyltransferase [Bacteroidales bacterium]